jgi:hypothetical protein
MKVALTDIDKINHFAFGESLPPECRPVLEHLGLSRTMGIGLVMGTNHLGGTLLYNRLILLILLGVTD